GGEAVRRDAGADPPDRGESTAQAAPPVPVEEAEGLPRVNFPLPTGERVRERGVFRRTPLPPSVAFLTPEAKRSAPLRVPSPHRGEGQGEGRVQMNPSATKRCFSDSDSDEVRTASRITSTTPPSLSFNT